MSFIVHPVVVFRAVERALISCAHAQAQGQRLSEQAWSRGGWKWAGMPRREWEQSTGTCWMRLDTKTLVNMRRHVAGGGRESMGMLQALHVDVGTCIAWVLTGRIMEDL